MVISGTGEISQEGYRRRPSEAVLNATLSLHRFLFSRQVNEEKLGRVANALKEAPAFPTTPQEMKLLARAYQRVCAFQPTDGSDDNYRTATLEIMERAMVSGVISFDVARKEGWRDAEIFDITDMTRSWGVSPSEKANRVKLDANVVFQKNGCQADSDVGIVFNRTTGRVETLYVDRKPPRSPVD